MGLLDYGQLKPVQHLIAAQFFAKKHLLVMAPRQEGKTELGVRLMHDLISIPETHQGLFLAKSKDAGKKATREKFMRNFDVKDFVVNTEIVYNRNCETSACFMDSVDKEPDKLRGGSYHLVHWSEVAFSNFEKGLTINDVLQKVIFPTQRVTHGYTFCESTPNGKNGWWELWENAEDFGFTKIRITMSQLVEMGLVSREEYEREKKRYIPLVWEQEYETAFVVFQGLMYSELRDHHIWKDMPPPKPWQKTVIAVDWGWNPSATCVLFGYVIEGRMCVFDEIYGLELRLDELHKRLMDKRTEWDISTLAGVGDHEPRSNDYLTEAGIPIGLARKVDVMGNRLDIKTRLHRNQLYIHPRCVNLLKDMAAATWDPKNPGDINEKLCTWGHYDGEAALRYLTRELAAAESYEPLTNPHVHDTVSQAAWEISRIREGH